jgi:hypothetical protein
MLGDVDLFVAREGGFHLLGEYSGSGEAANELKPRLAEPVRGQCLAMSRYRLAMAGRPSISGSRSRFRGHFHLWPRIWEPAVRV